RVRVGRGVGARAREGVRPGLFLLRILLLLLLLFLILLFLLLFLSSAFPSPPNPLPASRARGEKLLIQYQIRELDHLSVIAHDQGAHRALHKIPSQRDDRAVRQGAVDAVLEQAAELGQRLLGVVWQVGGLGPRHRFTAFDDERGVAGAVHEVRYPQAAVALESRADR